MFKDPFTIYTKLLHCIVSILEILSNYDHYGDIQSLDFAYHVYINYEKCNKFMCSSCTSSTLQQRDGIDLAHAAFSGIPELVPVTNCSVCNKLLIYYYLHINSDYLLTKIRQNITNQSKQTYKLSKEISRNLLIYFSAEATLNIGVYRRYSYEEMTTFLDTTLLLACYLEPEFPWEFVL